MVANFPAGVVDNGVTAVIINLGKCVATSVVDTES
jgi:hypothetical protein